MSSTLAQHRLITAEGFVTAVLAAAHLVEATPLSFRGSTIDEAFSAIWKASHVKSVEWGVDLCFSMTLHPLHGDCSSLRDVIMHLANLGVVEYRSADMFLFAGSFDDESAKRAVVRVGLPLDPFLSIVSQRFATIATAR